MRKIGTGIIILTLLIIAGCGKDEDQAKRYSEIQSECDSLISQADIAIEYQKAKTDSLRKIRDNSLSSEFSKNKVSMIDKKINDAVEVESNIALVKKHIEAIKTFAENGEKINKKTIYFKRRYAKYANTIQVHDEFIMIQEITNGIKAKQYISKYLPKESK